MALEYSAESPASGPCTATSPAVYAYARGLNYLRTRADEHAAAASTIVEHWFCSEQAVGGRRLCDYGSGFGDLSRAVLERAQARHAAPFAAITTVDDDARLADFAARQLERHAGASVDVEHRADLAAVQGRFDCILAAHVLYYVDDREAVVTQLARRLAPGGALTVVIRADVCDSFAIRSALRASAADALRHAAPRLTERALGTMLAAAGLRVRRASVTTRVTVPCADVRLDDLYGHRPSTDATELVRFLAHFDPLRHGEASAQVLAAVLEHHRDGGCYAFDLVTSIVTGRPVR